MDLISKPNIVPISCPLDLNCVPFPCHCQGTDPKLQVSMITFEDMIDRLEKNSGQTVVSLKEAKMLLKVRRDENSILNGGSECSVCSVQGGF